MRYTPHSPFRLLEKAMRRPSGDQAGWPSNVALRVRFLRPLPSGLTT
jgi:hypothetical protein